MALSRSNRILSFSSLFCNTRPSLSISCRNSVLAFTRSYATNNGDREESTEKKSGIKRLFSSSSSSNEQSESTASIITKVLRGDDSVEDTYSKLLARGKYVHEMQKHRVKPEYVEDYIKLVSIHFPRIAKNPENAVHLCGSWQADIGELDTFVHMWEYQGYTRYEQTQQKLRNDPEYIKFVKELRPMLRSRDNQICLEFAFWVTSPPAEHGGIYELRSYQLRPGHLLEWESYWRKGLECRRQFCQPVGAWFAQLGRLNQVHHMWQYADLETRKSTREAAWHIDGWAETVYKTVRLVEKMDAWILKPLPFSPLR
ncbi:10829_t:CDS:2 [Paraglomus occultum]|uniref:10829_t:CDS:1 n=1 Tax=Paraglomus occultum TaxID=144539 RepID=A0A9N9BNI5_9GLOM|nr:10829_t:CDS:2 [Paraglomus occultum]